jgi:hypothetical protein
LQAKLQERLYIILTGKWWNATGLPCMTFCSYGTFCSEERRVVGRLDPAVTITQKCDFVLCNVYTTCYTLQQW